MAVGSNLPHVLALINASTIATLLAGLSQIRAGNRERHRTCMIFAMFLGGAFLAFYLAYHLGAGLAKFGGEGVIRPIYFTILIAHIIGSVIATPLVPLAFWRGYSGQFVRHRHLAPLAWKLWMFVAVSGLVVYVMTIHIWPWKGVA